MAQAQDQGASVPDRAATPSEPSPAVSGVAGIPCAFTPKSKDFDASELDGSVSYWAKLRHDGLYDFGITVVTDAASARRDRTIKCGVAASAREASAQGLAARIGYLAAGMAR